MARQPGAVRHVPASAQAVVLVCRKCSRKLSGGFGPDGTTRLAKALGHVLRGPEGKRKPRRTRLPVIEVPCLDVCPKGAVVALRADRPGDWLVIERGTPIMVVAETLGLVAPAAKAEP